LSPSPADSIQKSRICTICARGGSVGIPDKNLRMIAGQPLIAHTLAQARASGRFDVIAVSSDSLRILDVARKCGVDELIERPAELATNTAGKVPAIHHCISAVEARLDRAFETIVDLDVTSPLRSVADILAAIDLLETRKASSVITGAPARRSPYFNLVEQDPETGFVRVAKSPANPVLRRQDAPACYDMNASIYVWQRDRFMDSPAVFYPDTLIHVMPEDRSIDIDSPLDFEIVEMLMMKRER